MRPERIFYPLLFMLSLIASPLTDAFAASWPLFRASPERTGALTERAEPQLTPRWSFEIQGEFVSSPVVYKGTVYCGGRDGSVWAWDAGTGEVLWQYSTSGWVDATPCVSSTTVYVPSRDRSVYAFDRLTGEIRWQTYTGSFDCSSPVLYEGKLYFLSGLPEKKVYCIDAESGAILAAYAASQFGFSSPAVKDNFLYFGTNDGKFHCLDLGTGQLRWSRQTEGGIFYSTLAAGEQAVYAVSGGDERRLFCLDPSNGNIIWQSVAIDTATSVVSSVSLGEESVFVASGAGSTLRLFAFPLTGTSPVDKLWETAIGSPHPVGILSSPAVAGTVVYIGSGDGRLYCLNAADGKYIEPGTGNLSAAATGYYLSREGSPQPGIVASPAVSDGGIYVGAYDGSFRALDAGKVTSISSPDNAEMVFNGTAVEGTTADPAFAGYTLAYGKGTAPAAWTEVGAGSAAVRNGTLGYWNTSSLEDGLYSLRVAVNGDLSKKAVNRVRINNSPRAPLGLSAADTPFDGGGSLALSWGKSPDDGAGSGDVAAYRIHKSTFAGGFALLAAVAAGTTMYVDTDCPAQTTYYYSLTAYDGYTESGFSNIAGAVSLVDGVEILPTTGGTVQLESEGMVTEVVVEPGTVEDKVWIGIQAPSSYPDASLPASAKATGIVREFGVTPAGTKFLKPVTVKVPYRPQDVVAMKRENLRLFWWDEAKGEWRIVNTSDPDAESGRVWARLPHFSLYRIMEYVPGRETLLAQEKVYTYPNPAKGDTVRFKYYLGDKADVTIDVYNVAGGLVAHLEKASNPAGIVSELEWDISRIASGVYVYRLEAKSASATKAVKKKLAIVH